MLPATLAPASLQHIGVINKCRLAPDARTQVDASLCAATARTVPAADSKQSLEHRYEMSKHLRSVSQLSSSQLANLLSALARFGRYPPSEVTDLLQRGHSYLSSKSWFLGSSNEYVQMPLPSQQEARCLLTAAKQLGYELPVSYVMACSQALLSESRFSLDDAALCFGQLQKYDGYTGFSTCIPERLIQLATKGEEQSPATETAGLLADVQKLCQQGTAVVGFCNLHPSAASRCSSLLQRTIQAVSYSHSEHAQAHLLQVMSSKLGAVQHTSGMWPSLLVLVGSVAPPSSTAAAQVRPWDMHRQTRFVVPCFHCLPVWAGRTCPRVCHILLF